MERYFNTLKSELIYHHSYSCDDKLFSDIEVYFNGVGQMLPPRQISPDEEKKPETTEWTVVSDFGGIIYPSDAPASAGIIFWQSVAPRKGRVSWNNDDEVL